MILDTDVLIDIDCGHPPALAWFASLTTLPEVAGFAAMELKQGCHNAQHLRKVETFLSVFVIAWPTEADMDRALASFGTLRLSHSLGLLDSLIAATALGRGLTVATFNDKHYSAFPGLITVQPYTR